ncbi:MAG: hypothetical protein AB7T22_15095 [Calditrichaceae bacterium]
MKNISLKIVILTFCMILPVLLTAQDKIEQKQGVYEYVVTKVNGDFTQVSSSLEDAINASGYLLLAKMDTGLKDECSYKSRIFVIYDSAYAKKLMDMNKLTAPFGIVDRFNLFEDEAGAHISIVNPVSTNRTILMEDEKHLSFLNQHKKDLRAVIEKVVSGTITNAQYGEFRKKGYIGRTMGVMAGGDFEGKIEEAAVVTGMELSVVLGKLENGFAKSDGKWNLHLIYSLNVPGKQLAVLGLSSAAVESKSFTIVKNGNDKNRDEFSCPGLAHAAAYPLEVVVVKESDGIKIKIVDAMFRMKMYFEDAGMMAFAKNMTMPGSIQDEIKDMIKSALEL